MLSYIYKIICINISWFFFSINYHTHLNVYMYIYFKIYLIYYNNVEFNIYRDRQIYLRSHNEIFLVVFVCILLLLYKRLRIMYKLFYVSSNLSTIDSSTSFLYDSSTGRLVCKYIYIFVKCVVRPVLEGRNHF